LIMMISKKKNIILHILIPLLLVFLVIILNSILLPLILILMDKQHKKPHKQELKLKDNKKRKMKFLYITLKTPNILENLLWGMILILLM
jgi:hypothetical protein